MYPATVSDFTVRALIRELAAEGALPSGAAVRAALKSRYGCRGGVARIYRLLAAERAVPNPSDPQHAAREVLELRAQLTDAQAREDAHQTRWAEEVDRLRQRVAQLEPLAQQAALAEERQAFLRHQLQAAVQRANALEERLLKLLAG